MSVITKTKEGGLVTKNSEKESAYRKKKAKDAEKHLDSFLEIFGESGLTEERQERSFNSPVAKKIVELGKNIGGLISSFEDTALQKIQAGGDSFIGGATAGNGSLKLSASVLIGLSTGVIILEALVILMFSVFRGVAQAIMRAGCALSDLFFVHFRSKFSDQNDYQEIMIAAITFVGHVYANARNLVAHFLSSIQQIIVGYVLVKSDKTVSSAVDNGINILGNLIEFYVLLYFLKAKVLILAIIVLTIISFFLKMDDVIKENSSAVKTRGLPTGFDFFDYVDDTTTANPLKDALDFLKSD